MSYLCNRAIIILIIIIVLLYWCTQYPVSMILLIHSEKLSSLASRSNLFFNEILFEFHMCPRSPRLISFTGRQIIYQNLRIPSHDFPINANTRNRFDYTFYNFRIFVWYLWWEVLNWSRFFFFFLFYSDSSVILVISLKL